MILSFDFGTRFTQACAARTSPSTGVAPPGSAIANVRSCDAGRSGVLSGALSSDAVGAAMAWPATISGAGTGGVGSQPMPPALAHVKKIPETRLLARDTRIRFTMALTRYVRGTFAVAIFVCFGGAASCDGGSAGSSGAAPIASSAAAPPSASAPASASTGDAREPDDDIKPVYPQTNEPPDPIAEKYCHVTYEVAETKRKSCCPALSFTPFLPTSECVRTLSYALRSKAISIEKSDLDACEAAVRKEAEQCDWGAEVPTSCKDILRGQMNENEACRSSLECKEGLHCAGLRVSAPGKCVPRAKDGQRCGGVADTLASFVSQDPEAKHPLCEGICDRKRCAPAARAGEKCISAVQCGPTALCLDGKCSERPLPKAGEACLGKLCEKGAVCAKDKCVAEKRLAEVCTTDDECRSHFCEGASAGKEGKCAMRCQAIPKSVK